MWVCMESREGVCLEGGGEKGHSIVDTPWSGQKRRRRLATCLDKTSSPLPDKTQVEKLSTDKESHSGWRY